MRNIVFASDFSKASRRAFAAALKTATESGRAGCLRQARSFAAFSR